MANKSRLARVSAFVVKECMAIKPSEKVAVITDTLRQEIGKSLFEAALKLSKKAVLVVMTPRTIDGEEPSREACEAIAKADVIIAPTSHSISHTKALTSARRNGARAATLPGITKDMYLRSVMADYKRINRLTKSIAMALNKDPIHVTTPSGTNITFKAGKRKRHYLSGLCLSAGEIVNLPDGETFIAPIESSANGVIAVDLSMAPSQGRDKIGLIIKPIKIIVRNGKAEEVKGGRQAKILKKILEKAGPTGRQLAEFGIGANPKAKIIGNVLEDEKVLGTVHFAFGSNKSFGGTNQSTIHLDGVISKPMVEVAGKKIMMNGKLKLK